MGKFLKWEDSNWRTYKIDTTAGTIKRPKKKITAGDMLGAIIEIDGAVVIPIRVVDSSTTIESLIVTDVTSNGSTTPTLTTLVYTKADDEFSIGEDEFDNIMIDEYGREEIFI